MCVYQVTSRENELDHSLLVTFIALTVISSKVPAVMACICSRYHVTFNPGLSNILNKVFLSNNMQVEFSKYC